MNKTKRICYRVVTPDGFSIFRHWPEAAEEIEKALLDKGWMDGYFAMAQQVEIEGELPEDTDWLERQLGR